MSGFGALIRSRLGFGMGAEAQTDGVDLRKACQGHVAPSTQRSGAGLRLGFP